MKYSLRLSSLMVALVAIVCACSYIFKPRETMRQLVAPEKMIPHTRLEFPKDTSFADSVMKSSSWGVVLLHSEYSNGNANALEAVRSWAAEQFHRDPRFLHPVVLPKASNNSTFLNASAYSLFAAPYFALSDIASTWMGGQIEKASAGPQFAAFRDDYVGLFGSGSEAATLLARYQADRARSAVNPVLSACYLLIAGLLMPLGSRRLRALAARWRIGQDGYEAAAVFAYFVFALALGYFAQAVIVESTAAWSLTAALVSLICGLFVLFPIRVFVDTQEVLLLRSNMDDREIKIFGWLFMSVLMVQALTWLKQGQLTEPDPITLIISALTGDFIHEHLVVKRALASGLAVLWSLSFAYILSLLSRRGTDSSKEVAKKLAALSSKM